MACPQQLSPLPQPPAAAVLLCVCFSASFVEPHFSDALCQSAFRDRLPLRVPFYCGMEVLGSFVRLKIESAFFFCLPCTYCRILSSYEFFAHVCILDTSYVSDCTTCKHLLPFCVFFNFVDKIARSTNVFNFGLGQFI